MVFIPENNSIVCYPSLNEIKLNIRFKYVFIFKSFKKERNWNKKCQFLLSNGVQRFYKKTKCLLIFF